MSGAQIIAGLEDAVKGNFTRAIVEGQHWKRMDDIRRASNANAWAIGVEGQNGFQVRRIVWGRMLARAEKRKGETIHKAVIYVAL